MPEMDVMRTALNAVEDLWTVYLTAQLDQSNSESTHNLSEECLDSARHILEYHSYSVNNVTIPGPMVIPLLDATGRQGPGLLTGNTRMTGSFDECFNYNYTQYCFANSLSPSPEITKRVEIPDQVVWSLGLCAPKGCNTFDIGFLINETAVLQAKQGTIKCIDSRMPDYNAGAIIMLIITSIFVLLIMVGTVVDNIPMIFAQNSVEKKHVNNRRPSYCDGGPVNSSETDKYSDSEREPLVDQKKKNAKGGVRPIEFLTAFSLFKTVPALLSTKQAPHVITSLNGMRVISMFWVILGHTYAHLALFEAVVDNRAIALDVFSRLSFQVVTQAYFCVDSFFFLSGVLLSYIVLREMKKRNGHFPFVPFYLHRYLRLTPTYAFVLFFAWFLTAHIACGPRLIDNFYNDACSSYWWTNLLYINNLYPWKLYDQCVGWTWYLAADTQFYVISPAIIIAAYYFIPAGIIIAGLILTSGFIVTAYLTDKYDFQANQFSLYAYDYVSKPGTSANFDDAIYDKPWYRIGPFIVGLALGYIIYKNYKLKFCHILNSILYGMMWAIAAFVALWLVFGLYFTWHGHVPTTTENVIYITFSRFLWAFSLALVVFACHNGYGWFINSFLSMKIWTPLARMTFCAYLVHPVLIKIFYGQLQTSVHYTDFTVACHIVAFVVLSYGVAALLCLLVELPLGTVEILVLKYFASGGPKKKLGTVRADSSDTKISSKSTNV